MGNIVKFPTNPGNGAREEIIIWMKHLSDLEHTDPEIRTDNLLAWLWVEGYHVVPLEKNDAAKTPHL